jgi:hypothetical protein
MPELLAALDAFLQEHRRCGELDGGEDGNGSGWPVIASRHRAFGRAARARPTSKHHGPRGPKGSVG